MALHDTVRTALRPALRLMPLPALGLGLWLLGHQMDGLRLGEIVARTGDIPAPAWVLAAVLTVLSLMAVGQYDVGIHRIAGTGVLPGRGWRAGMQAGALTQTLGFGPLVGTLVRWRVLPDLTLLQAGAVSALVSLSFFATGGLLLLLVATLASGRTALALAVLLLAGALVSRLRPFRRAPGLGPGRAGLLLLWTAVDLAAAAGVLAVLLPAGHGIAPLTLFAAYLAALGAGLVSQSPGGVGAFELTLIALLPQVAPADLLAAVAGYRLVYNALPAIVAAALLLQPGRWPKQPPLTPPGPSGLDRALDRAPTAEWGLCRQGATVLLGRDRAGGWLVRRAGPVLATLGPPLGRPDLAALSETAARAGLFACLYKCDGRSAVAARAAGWSVMCTGAEAWLDPATWTDAAPAARGLRRKLRAARAAGLTVSLCRPEMAPALHHARMAEIAADWAERHGGERGFSMGRYAPGYVARQVVVLGSRDGRIVGFATFHAGRPGWVLDLMRWTEDAPDGCMHALVAEGIAAARSAGVRRLSLAAVPRPPGWLGPLGRLAAAPGLQQFKRGFAPRWERRYLAAPGPVRLILALTAIAIAVRRPGALPVPLPAPLPDLADAAAPAQLPIAPPAPPCHPERTVIRRRASLSGPRPPLTGPSDDRRPLPPP